jgi:transposase-like protein
MASAVSLRRDDPAAELRRLAATTRNANQSRRLLSLAAVLDGMNRTEAARIGGMDRQTLRDWVHRFNEHGPEGLLDAWSKGRPRALRPVSRRSSEPRSRSSSRPARTGPCTASCAGVGSTCSASSSGASGSPITSVRSASSLRRSASRTAALARVIRHRTPARSRRSKKLPRHSERPSGRRRQAKADRDLVPGRGPDRPEERPRAAVGKTRNAAAPARRSALRERLSLRRDLSGSRHGRSPGAALGRHPRHAASP